MKVLKNAGLYWTCLETVCGPEIERDTPSMGEAGHCKTINQELFKGVKYYFSPLKKVSVDIS
mgnify:CR=1 FL=1